MYKSILCIELEISPIQGLWFFLKKIKIEWKRDKNSVWKLLKENLLYLPLIVPWIIYSIQDRFWLKKYILQLKLSNSDIKLTVKNIITTLAMQYTVSSWQPNVNKHQPITFKT